MESFSRFNMGFEEHGEEEEEFVKREGSSKKELALKHDGKSNEQKASTPRLKHSAIEQRRRSNINDRFQLLIGLLPNSEQKRDKASFLLEVIEYIQFLPEKVQMYESISPGSDENTRIQAYTYPKLTFMYILIWGGEAVADIILPQALLLQSVADHEIQVRNSKQSGV